MTPFIASKNLHFYEGPTICEQNLLGQEIVYHNGVSKICAPFEENDSLYELLSPNGARNDYEVLKTYLQQYKDKDHAHQVKTLHGNPVYMNFILTNINIIKLLDMQSLIVQTVALRGDATYNLDKVDQILMGYEITKRDH